MKYGLGWVRTDGLVVEDLGVAPVGIFSSQLPHVKERLPVNEVHQPVEVVPIKNPRAQELRTHWNTKTSTKPTRVLVLLPQIVCPLKL